MIKGLKSPRNHVQRDRLDSIVSLRYLCEINAASFLTIPANTNVTHHLSLTPPWPAVSWWQPAGSPGSSCLWKLLPFHKCFIINKTGSPRRFITAVTNSFVESRWAISHHCCFFNEMNDERKLPCMTYWWTHFQSSSEKEPRHTGEKRGVGGVDRVINGRRKSLSRGGGPKADERWCGDSRNDRRNEKMEEMYLKERVCLWCM